MKRYLLIATIFVFIAVMVCACTPDPSLHPGQNGNQTEAPEPAPPPRNAVRLTMDTGAVSGTYYPYGGTLALAIHAATGYIKINVNPSGGSVENIQQIAGGLADLAIAQNDMMEYAYNGSDIWNEEPVKNMATLMSLYPEVCQLIVAGDSGIMSIDGMKGKRISIGAAGSAIEANALQILAAYGLTKDDLLVQNLGFDDAAAAMKDNEIDGFFVTSGLPNTAVLNLSTSLDIRMIAMADNKINYLLENHSFYSKTTITERDYNFITEPINTVAVQATLIARADLDEQMAYDIVKAIIESKEGIMVANAKGVFIDPKFAVQAISVGLHPGAKRYLKEIDVL